MTLSLHNRLLTYGIAAAFAVLGVVFFLAPNFSAVRFPWKVSAFLAMTIGAWYLGTAVFAWRSARDWRWPRVHPLLIYVWAFSLGQAALLFVNGDDIRTGKALAWPYILVVLGAAVASVVGIVSAVRARASFGGEGAAVPWVVRVLTAAFVAAVVLLALPLLDGYDNPESIWPGQLTLLSARAFAVFFLALAVSALAVALARGFAPVLAYARAGIPLTVGILVAAAIYRDRFDIGDHPGQLLYLGLYVAVLALALAIIVWAERAR